jgi:hypothetical protein
MRKRSYLIYFVKREQGSQVGNYFFSVQKESVIALKKADFLTTEHHNVSWSVLVKINVIV